MQPPVAPKLAPQNPTPAPKRRGGTLHLNHALRFMRTATRKAHALADANCPGQAHETCFLHCVTRRTSHGACLTYVQALVRLVRDVHDIFKAIFNGASSTWINGSIFRATSIAQHGEVIEPIETVAR
jgi:hypothetical protein